MENIQIDNMLKAVLENQATEIALLKEQILLLKQQNLRLAQLHEVQVGHWAAVGVSSSRDANETYDKHLKEMRQFRENEAKAKEEITAEANRAKKEATELYLGR
ncbi:MAG: hypothetical protein ACLRFR_02415 [Clostridia bacterium]